MGSHEDMSREWLEVRTRKRSGDSALPVVLAQNLFTLLLHYMIFQLLDDYFFIHIFASFRKVCIG